MAFDPAKPSQGVDLVTLLLPLLLQSANGKQIDIMQLLTVLLTGKSVTPPVPVPVAAPAPQPQQPSQVPADIITLLLPLIYERLTGKSWPGTTPDVAKQADVPTTPAQPATSRPSVQFGAAGLGVTAILQALGTVGTPFGLGANPTPAGTLATLIPIIIGAFGATGGFGALLSAGSALLGGLSSAAAKK
jgi:hypothetical protein